LGKFDGSGILAGAVHPIRHRPLSSQLTRHQRFSCGTLLINILGWALVGFVRTGSADHDHDRWRLLMAAGFCEAFTTFSAFA